MEEIHWTRKFITRDMPYSGPKWIKMVDDSLGFLTEYLNMYKTSNAGETWQSFNLDSKNHIYGPIEFYNEDLGVLSASSESISNSGYFDISNIYFTTNGGNIWIKVPNNSDSKTSYFDKMKFTDPTHLWAINQNGLWLSNDTAKTWQKLYGGDYFIGGYSFDFYDSLFGVITTSYNSAYLTTDGGNSWNEFSKPTGNHPTDCKILGPDYSGGYRILECGSNGKLLLTYMYPDGTIDYSYQMPSLTSVPLNKIDVYVKDNFPYVWVGGNGFTLLYREFEKISTSVNENNNQPTVFNLYQNYPNPFNPTTKIKYSIPIVVMHSPAGSQCSDASVQLKIYDILGREMATLVNKEQQPGEYEVEFNASNFSSGIYFYRLTAGSYISTKKMILLK